MANSGLALEADLAFDRNEYRNALDLYRGAARQAKPTPANSTLGNSGLASDLDQLVFLDSIVERYPDSLECGLHLALWLNQMKNARRAVACCDDLLARHSASYPGPLDVRVQRMIASLGNHKHYPLLLEDCPIIWEIAGRMDNPATVRTTMLHRLAAVADPLILPVFRSMTRQAWVTPGIHRFLEAKMGELRSLQELLAGVTVR